MENKLVAIGFKTLLFGRTCWCMFGLLIQKLIYVLFSVGCPYVWDLSPIQMRNKEQSAMMIKERPITRKENRNS
jgi:hypothetical protein